MHNGDNARLRLFSFILKRQHMQSNFMTLSKKFHSFQTQGRQYELWNILIKTKPKTNNTEVVVYRCSSK